MGPRPPNATILSYWRCILYHVVFIAESADMMQKKNKKKNTSGLEHAFEGHAGQRNHRLIETADPASQLYVSTVGTNVILTKLIIIASPTGPQILHLPVHPLYCQPRAEDLHVLQRLVDADALVL